MSKAVSTLEKSQRPDDRSSNVTIVTVVSLFVVAVIIYFLPSLDKGNRIANYESIGVKPTIYLQNQGLRSMQGTVNPEDLRKLNRKVLPVVTKGFVPERSGIKIGFGEDYAVVCIDDNCRIFSKEPIKRSQVDDIINSIDS
jgi:hypothetical protein